LDAQVLLGVLVFLVSIFLGMPIFACFLLGTLVISVLLGLNIGAMPGAGYWAVNSSTLLAVALFVLGGNIMSQGGIAEPLTRLAYALVGRVRGGLAAVCIVTALFFAALTGSGLASIAATGTVLITRMERYGYDRRYSTAVICASGFLGYLIPPSIPVLIYAFIAQQSIAALFLSTVIPGILVAAGYLGVNYFTCQRWIRPVSLPPEEAVATRGANAYFRNIVRTGYVALPALFCPVVVLGGIYLGVFTPTEAAAVAAVYSAFVGVLVYRQLNWKNAWTALRDTTGSCGMLFILVVFAVIFTRTLMQQGLGDAVAEFFLRVTGNRYVLLLLIIGLLLLLGMFIENISIMLVVTPVLLPLFKGAGFNLVHMGAMIIVAMGIALTTPPFADALFLGARIGRVPFISLVKPLLPFLLFAAIPVLLITAFVPEISLWLPTLVCGERIVLGP